MKNHLLNMQRKARMGLYEGSGRAELCADLKRVVDWLDATHGELKQPAQQELNEIVHRSMCHE